jgi:hypothetical protein
MDRPEMGFFNGITTTTRRLHQEEEWVMERCREGG